MGPQNVHRMSVCLLLWKRGIFSNLSPAAFQLVKTNMLMVFLPWDLCTCPGCPPQTWVRASTDHPPQACLTAIPNASVPSLSVPTSGRASGHSLLLSSSAGSQVPSSSPDPSTAPPHAHLQPLVRSPLGSPRELFKNVNWIQVLPCLKLNSFPLCF